MSGRELRVVSLLPSATDAVVALGMEHLLVGRTHECDWQSEAHPGAAVPVCNTKPHSQVLLVTGGWANCTSISATVGKVPYKGKDR